MFSAALSLCFALLSLAAALFSEALRSLHLGCSPCQLASQGVGSFPLSQLSLRISGPILIPFLFSSLSVFSPFVVPSYVEGFFPFLKV